MTLPPFSTLLETHQDGLYRFLLFKVGNPDADDCFQETVISALRAYPQLTNDRNLKGWLFTIAHRKAQDHFRRRTRTTVALDEVAEPTAEQSALPFDAGTARAIARLADGQRSALELRYLGDLSYADVARALQCSEAAARRRVADALENLREIMR